jgi:gephyrin
LVCETELPRSVIRHNLPDLAVHWTCQAIRPLLEREASGIVHLLLSASLKHTPLAALSRPVAGTVENTLIVTLPGSVKAVKENLEVLLSNGVAEHAIDLIKGGTGQRVHTDLASSMTPLTVGSDRTPGDHHHHHHRDHHHGHHDHHHTPQPRTVLSHDPSLAGMLMTIYITSDNVRF